MLWVIVWQLDRLYTSLEIEIRLPFYLFLFSVFFPPHTCQLEMMSETETVWASCVTVLVSELDCSAWWYDCMNCVFLFPECQLARPSDEKSETAVCSVIGK